MNNYRKHGLTALKIVISALLIYFIFTKLDIDEVFSILSKANWFYLALAFVLIALSKVVASYRLNLFFHQIAVPLTQKSNLKLYLLGMFYNLFLPGGIGGDAYKGYVIRKKYQIGSKLVISALVVDRLSGLLLIFLYSCTFAYLLNLEIISNYSELIVLTGLLAIVVFWFVNKKFFPTLFPVFWKAFGCSALVQGTQLVGVLLILKSLAISSYTLAYMFIFMISSIVSVIPLTIGGIGSRELTFFYGAELLGLEENAAVGVSMLFFLLTALISLFGIYYHFKKPTLETEPLP